MLENQTKKDDSTREKREETLVFPTNNRMKITFYGGARTVTGANYLLESGGTKLLIDCGLHQGSNYSEDLNFEPFPYSPKEINAVCVTHAHIDHIGRIPQLVKRGFLGSIYSTPPTMDMAEALLIDAEHILSEEAEKRELPPIYVIGDIVKTMGLWKKQLYHQKFIIGPFEVEFYDAGHVLGSSSIVIRADGKTIVFSGDLGNTHKPFLKPTEPIQELVDYALIESTYGGRIHEKIKERKNELERVIHETIRKNGVLLIPAFALERTQEMIFELNELVENKKIPNTPVFVDSPLAIKLTAVYEKYCRDPLYFNNETIDHVNNGDEIFDFPGLRFSLTQEESKSISRVPAPKVIIAGAGMSQGGRVLYHEKQYLGDERNTILFVGFQAKGSLGRLLVEKNPSVMIQGERIHVRAHIELIDGYSAHADQAQLVRWISLMKNSIKKTFIVQGEENESEALSKKIKDEFGCDTHIPSFGETVVL